MLPVTGAERRTKWHLDALAGVESNRGVILPIAWIFDLYQYV
jgi:hypothetical protein